MKKIVLSIIVALIAITANAQVYVGGTFGVGSDKVETEGTEVKKREFEIKSKNSKLSVIDKLYVNGGLLFKKAVCRDSRQGVGYKVTE